MNEDKKIRVLLVDDVPELRLLVKLTLEEEPDIEVVGEASTGREGVEAIAATQPDVVLLDLSMPDMDGLEAIPLMRERSPGSRLVVLSGHEAGRLSLEALDQGATRYVNKATGLDALKKIVRDVAALEPPFTDERFGIVREMWEAFLHGQVDRVLERTASDATWRPYIARGREFRTHEERRQFLAELLMRGRVVDPRAYGVEPHGNGLVVLGRSRSADRTRSRRPSSSGPSASAGRSWRSQRASTGARTRCVRSRPPVPADQQLAPRAPGAARPSFPRLRTTAARSSSAPPSA